MCSYTKYYSAHTANCSVFCADMKRRQSEISAPDDAQQHRKTERLKKYRAKKKEMKSKTIQPHVPRTEAEISSNWKALQAILSKESENKEKTRKEGRPRNYWKGLTKKAIGHKKNKAATENKDLNSEEIWFDDVDPDDIEMVTGKKVRLQGESDQTKLVSGGFEGITKRIAMDCEMVGVGSNAQQHMLARVSLVNSHGNVIYDKFVAPREKVKDYRTAVSGIRPDDLKNAPSFKIVQKEVADMIKGRVLVGHAVKNDLKVLFLTHPGKDIRDTARYKPFQEMVKSKHPALRKLANGILQIQIQEGEHSSVQDAQAAMKLYNLHKKEWERSLKEKRHKMPPAKQAK